MSRTRTDIVKLSHCKATGLSRKMTAEDRLLLLVMQIIG